MEHLRVFLVKQKEETPTTSTAGAASEKRDNGEAQDRRVPGKVQRSSESGMISSSSHKNSRADTIFQNRVAQRTLPLMK